MSNPRPPDHSSPLPPPPYSDQPPPEVSVTNAEPPAPPSPEPDQSFFLGVSPGRGSVSLPDISYNQKGEVVDGGASPANSPPLPVALAVEGGDRLTASHDKKTVIAEQSENADRSDSDSMLSDPYVQYVRREVGANLSLLGGLRERRQAAEEAVRTADTTNFLTTPEVEALIDDLAGAVPEESTLGAADYWRSLTPEERDAVVDSVIEGWRQSGTELTNGDSIPVAKVSPAFVQEPEQPAHRAAARYGFTTSPNPQFHRVAEIFGRTLAEEPEIVVVTGEDKRIIAQDRADRQALSTQAVHEGQPGFHYPYDPEAQDYRQSASYDSKHNLIFMSEGAYHTPWKRAHETAHAFVHDINPSIDVLFERLGEVCDDPQRRFDLGITKRVIARAVVARAFDEGLADWVAIEAEPQDAAQHQADLLHAFESDPEGHIAALKRSVGLFHEGILKGRIDLFDLAGSSADGSLYEAGYYFAHRAMERLRNLGMSPDQLPRELGRLILHPPQTLLGLRNPSDFIDWQMRRRNN